MKKVVRTPVRLTPEQVRERYERDKRYIRMLVRTRQDFQLLRIALDGRRGVKKDGTPKGHFDHAWFQPKDLEEMARLSKEAAGKEKQYEKLLDLALQRMPIYPWLKSIDGLNTISAGWICGEFNIFKAGTPSKMEMYAGMNPNEVYGVKRVDKGRGKVEFVQTTTLVPADRLTRGFVAPFNISLRAALLGGMATSFIAAKKKNKYVTEFYYPYKHRLENSSRLVKHDKEELPWSEVSKGHRDRAARRKMVKMFLIDLYTEWRPMYGLLVRPPFMEEYLGKKHAVGEN